MSDLKKTLGFKAGIHVLIKKGELYLLLKRSQKDIEDPDFWDLPGGGIKYLEKPLDAALREVKEETGINVKIIKILDIWAKLHEGKWTIESLIEAEYLAGIVVLSKEHSGYMWVTKNELKKIEPKGENLKALFNINESLIGNIEF